MLIVNVKTKCRMPTHYTEGNRPKGCFFESDFSNWCDFMRKYKRPLEFLRLVEPLSSTNVRYCPILISILRYCCFHQLLESIGDS